MELDREEPNKEEKEKEAAALNAMPRPRSVDLPRWRSDIPFNVITATKQEEKNETVMISSARQRNASLLKQETAFSTWVEKAQQQTSTSTTAEEKEDDHAGRHQVPAEQLADAAEALSVPLRVRYRVARFARPQPSGFPLIPVSRRHANPHVIVSYPTVMCLPDKNNSSDSNKDGKKNKASEDYMTKLAQIREAQARAAEERVIRESGGYSGAGLLTDCEAILRRCVHQEHEHKIGNISRVIRRFDSGVWTAGFNRMCKLQDASPEQAQEIERYRAMIEALRHKYPDEIGNV